MVNRKVRQMSRHIWKSRRYALLLLGGAAVAGCSRMKFPTTERGQASLVDRGINVLNVTSANIAELGDPNGVFITSTPNNPPRDPNVYVYRAGTGDQLRVQTWSTPERRGGEGEEILEGPVVNEEGQFFYPYVGMMDARGRSVTEIRAELESKLRTYLTDPQVEVDIQNYNAHRVTLVGEVATRGSTTLNNIPLRLLELINRAGVTETSDLRRVEIRRRGRDYSVNLRSFIEFGTSGHNPILLPGDVVFVPALADNKVFVFGAMGGGEVTLGAGKQSLTEVLAKIGGIDSHVNARGIFVFRRPPGKKSGFNVFQFDLSDASALMTTSRFFMSPMDVVFVSTDPISEWSETVDRVLSPVTGIVRARAISEQITE